MSNTTPMQGMLTRTLGSTGKKVSAIGIGGRHVGLKGVDEQLSIRIIRTMRRRIIGTALSTIPAPMRRQTTSTSTAKRRNREPTAHPAANDVTGGFQADDILADRLLSSPALPRHHTGPDLPVVGFGQNLHQQPDVLQLQPRVIDERLAEGEEVCPPARHSDYRR